MTNAYSLFTHQPITLMGLAQFQTQAVNTAAYATNPASAAPAVVDEPTLVGIQLPVRADPSVLSSDIVEDLLSYEKLRVTPQEIVRFSGWLNEKRFGVGFFTKAVEYLIQMRREDAAFDEEITQVRRLSVRRSA